VTFSEDSRWVKRLPLQLAEAAVTSGVGSLLEVLREFGLTLPGALRKSPWQVTTT